MLSAPALLLALTACSGAPADQEGRLEPPSQAEWTTATAALFEDGLTVRPDAALLILPAVSADDVYATSMALIGAGDAAADMVRRAGRDVVAGRLARALDPEVMAKSIAGPVATPQVILQADDRTSLLSQEQREALLSTVSQAIADPGSLDLYTAAAAVTALEGSGRRDDRARAAFAGVAAGALKGKCTGTETLYLLGTAAGIEESIPGCSPPQVEALWSEQWQELERRLEDPGADVGLAESQALLALARLDMAQKASARRTAALAGALQEFDRAFVEGRAADVTPVSADLALVADLLRVPREVPGVALAHLELVVVGGADADTVKLDAGSLAMALRTGLAVGTRALPDPSTMRTDDPIGRLELLLAAETIDREAVVVALAPALKKTSDNGLGVVLRGAYRVGTPACQIPGLSAALSRALAHKAGAPGIEPVTHALAVGLLTRCGRAAEATELAGELRQRAMGVLERIEAQDERQPPLLETWQAAASMCVLDKSSVPEASILWKSYASEAFRYGGARSAESGHVDLATTFALATLTAPSTDRCPHDGLLA